MTDTLAETMARHPTLTPVCYGAGWAVRQDDGAILTFHTLRAAEEHIAAVMADDE